MSRRLLSETLGEIASGAIDALSAAPSVQIRRIAVVLPIELVLLRSGEQDQLFGDVPRFVTRTEFDIQPGRLEVVWERGDTI